MTLRRRSFLASPALLAAGRGAACAAAPGDPGPIAAIEQTEGGRLGVFLRDTGSGRTLGWRAEARFAMASTFKAPLAAMVLARVDKGADALDDMVRFSARDLVPASPVTQARVAEGRMSVGALCQAILERSDNTAANLLLRRAGGPAALTAYIRELGDTVTRVDRYEPIGTAEGDLDTTTPAAMAGLMERIVLGNALQTQSRDKLRSWMMACVPGRTRLRAALPPDWAVADRTGTSDTSCNDVAVVWPPGRAPLIVAAYYENAAMDMERREQVLRNVGRAVCSREFW